jgi:hypothetical protein
MSFSKSMGLLPQWRQYSRLNESIVAFGDRKDFLQVLHLRKTCKRDEALPLSARDYYLHGLNRPAQIHQSIFGGSFIERESDRREKEDIYLWRRPF